MKREEILIKGIQDYLLQGKRYYLNKDDLKIIVEALKRAESCEDCISRQAAIDATIDAVDEWDGGCNLTRAKIITNAINKLPSVQPTRPKGKWIDIGSGTECSICHEIQYGYDNYRFFCPNCGANMKGDKE